MIRRRQWKNGQRLQWALTEEARGLNALTSLTTRLETAGNLVLSQGDRAVGLWRLS